MIVQSPETKRRTTAIPSASPPQNPEAGPSQALADDLARLEHAERETRDRVRQQELEQLRKVARFD